jgi:hypothetical protein
MLRRNILSAGPDSLEKSIRKAVHPSNRARLSVLNSQKMLQCNITSDLVMERHALTLHVTPLSVAPRFAALGSAEVFISLHPGASFPIVQMGRLTSEV